MDRRSGRLLFGMETEPVAAGLAWKWRAVELEIGREAKVLADCRAQKPCSNPARELLDIIAEGSGHSGRARVGLINRAVQLAITPTTDEAHLFPDEYHAVTAARVNEEWLILDNRWLTLVRDSDMRRSIPKFVIDENGVNRFVRDSRDVPGRNAGGPIPSARILRPV